MKNFFSKMNPFKKDSKTSNTNQKQIGASIGGGTLGRGSQSGGAKYPYGLSNFGYSKLISNKRVRQNARQAFHDSPEAKAIITRFTDTIVDTGLKLESTPEAAILGISPEEAETWAKDVERRFNLWANSKNADRRKMRNFYQIQRLYQISQQRDNDVFVRFYYSKKKKVANKLQVSILDPNQIRGDSLTSTYTFSSIKDGIVRNDKGEEVAYKIYVKDFKTGESKEVEVPRIGRNSGRTMMVHAFCPEYAGQNRGYSRLEHVLQEFEEITDFKLSAIKKAISQSQLTMYVKPSNNNDASNPLEDLTSSVSGPQTAGTSIEAAVQEADDLGPLVSYDGIPEAEINVPGSIGVFNLKKGEDLKAFDAATNSEDFDKFIETYMSYISASIGIPNEVLLMKFGQNYSASRGALLLYWRVVLMWRAEMATDFLDPTYEAWLAEEIAAGRISAPGFQDPILKEAWLSNKWIGAPMPNIDPMRTAKAEMAYIEMGATSLDRVAREYNGSDGAANRRKLEREFEELPIAKWNRTEISEQEANKDEDD